RSPPSSPPNPSSTTPPAKRSSCSAPRPRCGTTRGILAVMVEDEEVEASEIERRMAREGVPVDAEQAAKLAAFVGLLVRWNRVHNLTGVRGAAELVDRHLVESLALRPYVRGVRVADVGSGGGLPGLPLAITEPGCQFTLIESRAKRVHFLRHAIAELALRNSDVAHGRAEHLRVAQPFDTVLARAVAPPAELLSIC